MKRTREYRRSVAESHIARKKWISNTLYHFDWYRNDNQYSKNKVFCSCPMWRGYNMYLGEMELKRFQMELDSQTEEMNDLDLRVRVPNRYIHWRSSRRSHGWK